ncbi:thioesterase family protein [Mycolicibacterium sp.]|uniref:thioesterase family protein n=1 Tax=Mycolicibacterium sp. TaxID=2320850 RepID=UPI0037C7F36A
MTTAETGAAGALRPSHHRVIDEWIDYNGHLNEGYFGVLFGRAVDDVLEQIGAGADYRRTSNCAVFSAEAHIRYLAEVPPRSQVEIRNCIIAAGAKLIVTWHELYVDGKLCATEEVLGLHVDRTVGRVAPFPDDIRTRAEGFRVDPPTDSGRSIQVRDGGA